MAEERVQRRLAAIISADVVGYSSLMEQDEAGTLARLKSLRSEFLHPKIAEFGGRIVKTTGDGTLIEFASAVDAVSHAVDVQRGMSERNAGLPKDQRIRLRLGVNLGDIMIDGEDIFGDGVNVAARLEALAEPGGVCISGTVYEHVRNKLDAAFEDLGEQQVKNIARPVRVYRLQAEPGRAETEDDQAVPPVPDRPSIAVLPFDNLSADPEQGYFSDGMAEDLITDLSKISDLSVAARHSSFTFKGQSADVTEVARKLGVAFILEGSVRKMANRLRINAQLIDAVRGTHVWAERFDGDVAEIFDFQDRIRKEIISALALKLTPAEASRSKQQRTTNIEAYDHVLRGRSEYYRYGPDHVAKAIEHFTAAIKLDPSFADPYGYLSYCYFARFMMMWPGADPDLGPALEAAEKAVTLDPSSAVALSRLAWVQGFLRHYDESFSNFEKAIALEPDNAEALAGYAEILNYWGDPERAIELNARAVNMSTVALPNWEYNFGHSYMLLRRYDEAIAQLRRAIELAPKFLPPHVRLTCAYAELDRLEDTEQAAARVLELNPGFSIMFWDEFTGYRTPEQRERFRSALRKAGLPE